MNCTLGRGAWATLSAVAILLGCQSGAPLAPTSAPAVTYGSAGAQMTSGSFELAVYTRAPQLPANDGSIWYYGSHPHPPQHPLGSFCDLQGSHRHDYAPYRHQRYVFHDGHYFWIGDAKPYALADQPYAYYGHHPLPHYFGGYCRIRGLHQHAYAPQSPSYYRLKSGAYFFTGVYGADYYADRARYDAQGWDREDLARGYHEHERDWGQSQVADAAVDRAPAIADAHKRTSRELIERMRARHRANAQTVPANAAPDAKQD